MGTPAMQLPESLAKSIASWPQAILYGEAGPRQRGPTINDAQTYSPARPGGRDEWHVDLLNSFQQFTFDFVPGFHHAIVFLLPAFSLSWLKAR